MAVGNEMFKMTVSVDSDFDENEAAQPPAVAEAVETEDPEEGTDDNCIDGFSDEERDSIRYILFIYDRRVI